MDSFQRRFWNHYIWSGVAALVVVAFEVWLTRNEPIEINIAVAVVMAALTHIVVGLANLLNETQRVQSGLSHQLGLMREMLDTQQVEFDATRSAQLVAADQQLDLYKIGYRFQQLAGRSKLIYSMGEFSIRRSIDQTEVLERPALRMLGHSHSLAAYEEFWRILVEGTNPTRRMPVSALITHSSPIAIWESDSPYQMRLNSVQQQYADKKGPVLRLFVNRLDEGHRNEISKYVSAIKMMQDGSENVYCAYVTDRQFNLVERGYIRQDLCLICENKWSAVWTNFDGGTIRHFDVDDTASLYSDYESSWDGLIEVLKEFQLAEPHEETDAEFATDDERAYLEASNQRFRDFIEALPPSKRAKPSPAAHRPVF